MMCGLDQNEIYDHIRGRFARLKSEIHVFSVFSFFLNMNTSLKLETVASGIVCVLVQAENEYQLQAKNEYELQAENEYRL